MRLYQGADIDQWDESQSIPYNREAAKRWLATKPPKGPDLPGHRTVPASEVHIKGGVKQAWMYKYHLDGYYKEPFLYMKTNNYGKVISHEIIPQDAVAEDDLFNWLETYLNTPLKLSSPKDFEADDQNIVIRGNIGDRRYTFDAEHYMVFVSGKAYAAPNTVDFHDEDEFGNTDEDMDVDEAEADFQKHLSLGARVQNIQEMNSKFEKSLDKVIAEMDQLPPQLPQLPPQFHDDDQFQGGDGCECERCEPGDGIYGQDTFCGCEGPMIDSESVGILCQRHFDAWREGGDVSWDDPMVEGIAPLSHDNTIARKIRKHQTPRSRRHMDGSDRYRMPDPAKKVKARLKRDSRHQNRPEVEEAVSFLQKHNGKPITEADLQGVQDRDLLSQAVDFLTAMAAGGWSQSNDGITNGNFILEDETVILKDGHLLYNNNPLKLNWEWLHSVKQLLQKR